MANSRRRERELARRRYERRRLREQQQRARRRRRNTIAGASAGTAAVIALIVFLAVHFSGGSDKASAAPRTTPPVSATPTPSATPPPPPAPTKCAQIKPNPPAKGQPTVPPVSGKAPTKLVIKDIKHGHGPAAKKGSSVSVTYIGISCSTGKVFDASYLHGNQPFEVKPLGQASVIQGWNQGLVGVRAGGVRELVIPAALGYGPAGNQGIKPNETLIFLITVKSVQA
ncbi:MAG: FKBP-type peptidyl-prolyl cis-trans isomerase FkpA [Frankiaceae bacterium]|nr:FKBP-type peptidyl-prolyl cis-trans isomerase FkpA [Frankiaceae bacterium]